ALQLSCLYLFSGRRRHTRSPRDSSSDVCSSDLSDEVVEEREPVNVNKDNINEVMKSFGLSLDVAVPDKLSDEPGQEISASLKFESMKDFSPDSVARQVPELKKLLELRQALQALKGPLGNVPAFRKGIQEILKDDESRKAIMQELGLDPDEK